NRAIAEPQTEGLVRGPRDGFIESLSTNLSLIRRRLRTPDFRIHKMIIGQYTRTEVAICYLEGLADPSMINELLHRLKKIHIDGVLESGYLEQFIEDNHFSPFPQIHYTERPDRVAANLLEGRVAIVTDGTPFVLIAP